MLIIRYEDGKPSSTGDVRRARAGPGLPLLIGLLGAAALALDRACQLDA